LKKREGGRSCLEKNQENRKPDELGRKLNVKSASKKKKATAERGKKRKERGEPGPVGKLHKRGLSSRRRGKGEGWVNRE